MRFFKFIANYLLGIIGIILISCTPALIGEGLHFNVNKFFESLRVVIQTIFSPSEWEFYIYVNFQFLEKPLFAYIFDNYLYSMTILFSALFISVMAGFSLALITFQLPQRVKKTIHRLLNSLEALPDILFIFLLQLLVVWIFKKTGVLIFDFAYLGEEKIYLSPILSLSILPTVLFYKTVLLLLSDEWSKDYVILAKSKGFSSLYILFYHCLRNIKKTLIIQSRPILWATLSSLLVVEYLHNFYGIVRLIFFDTRPFTITVALILIFTPFYLLYNLLEWIFKINSIHSFESNARMFKGKKTFSRNHYSKSVSLESWLSLVKSVRDDLLKLARKPKFTLGILFIGGWSIVSLLYTILNDQQVNQLLIFQDDNGNYHSPAHPPGILFLGSDTYGYSIFEMLLTGAKYTILVSFLIAFLRVLIGYILTIPYIFWLGERSKAMVSRISDGMQFLPLSLIAYVLLVNVVIFEEERRKLAESLIVPNLILEIVILVIFVIPVTLNVIGREANNLLKTEYIQSALTLGASKSRIFFQHISIPLFSKITYLFGQQMIQVLQVFVHLSVFTIFLGGSLQGRPAQSLIYEWTSMFENLRMGIMTGQYWMFLPMLILYVLLIFSIQAVIKSVIEVQQEKVGNYSNLRVKKLVKTKRVKTFSTNKSRHPFTFLELEKDGQQSEKNY